MIRPKAAETLHHQIDGAIHILTNGGVVALPTDTLYCLAAHAFDEAAAARIFRLKGRPTDTALPLLLADPDEISRWARDIPDMAWDLARRFWPGPLTMVLRRSPDIPRNLCGGTDTVGLRVPDHRIPRNVARTLGAPITGTSANRTGEESLTTAEAVRAVFGEEIDMIVDGGKAPGGPGSTVLDLSEERPRILRRGPISARQIEDACGQPVAS